LLRAQIYEQAAGERVVLISVHHIALDGTALFVALEELLALYSALLHDTPIPAASGAASFAEFAEWQAAYVAGAERDRAYWANVLSPPATPLELPTNRMRGAAKALRGASLWTTLDAGATSALKVLARDEGVTPYVVLLTLWFVLLHRLTGKSDVTVGTPVLGRPAARFERTVGDLINMLPFRVREIDRLTFRAALKRVRTVVLEGMARQDYPLPRMVEQAQRTEYGVQPFDTLFVLQDFSRFASLEKLMLADDGERVTCGDLTLTPFRLNQQEGQFELSLEVWPRRSTLLCAWRYDRDLFDAHAVHAWTRAFETLVTDALARPDAPVTELAVLGPAERQRVVAEWNATALPYATDRTVVDLIADQARLTPHGVAVSFEGCAVTYAELDKRANRLAGALRSLGVAREALVGVCLERSPDMIVAVLAILKAGAAYVPLDPGFPLERLRYMLKDSGAVAIVTTTALAAALAPEEDIRVVALDRPEDLPAEAMAPLDGVGPRDRAYVLYTSGSTGQPKGVEIEHRSLTNFVSSMQREPGIAPTDVVLAITTLSFDIAGLELFLPLVVGARIELVRRETALDAVALARCIADSGATMMQATPATWRMLLDSGWSGQSGLKALCGGEALGRDLAASLLARCAELWNMYGPTETTIWSTVERIRSADDVTIGRPIANTQTYVLDGRREPVPEGVVGELWIGGDGVARGYLNRPELTAQRFAPNPFHGGSMYRTGDLARYCHDGRLQCLGRSDDQVKIRGYRIELGEIEAVLGEHPGIGECAVVARDVGGDRRLIAYYVGAVDVAQYREHLRARLPEYMIPAAFVCTPALPRTPNNKIDRNALPNPAGFQADVGGDYRAPTTPEEKLVAALFEDVLGVVRVGASQHFFELGGHSLSATRVISKLHAQHGIDVPLRALFDAPTVAEFARRVTAARASGQARGAVVDEPVAPAAYTIGAPLLHAQERLWFVEQLQAARTGANVPLALRLRGALDVAALESALRALVAAHDALRSVYHMQDGAPVQTLHAHEVRLERLSLATLDSTAAARALGAALERHAGAPLDVATGPLWRFALIELSRAEHVLALTFHHLVCDGWSVGLMLRDLALAYGAAAGGEPGAALLPPRPSLHGIAAVERARAAAKAELQLAYWRARLAPLPETVALPADVPRAKAPTLGATALDASLPADLSSAISSFCRAHHLTPFVVLMGVFHVLLRRYTSARVTPIGTPTANRQSPGTEEVVGLFMNPLPLIVASDDDMTVIDLLRQIRKDALDMLEHQEVPFDRLVRETGAVRGADQLPLFRQMLIYQALPVSSPRFGALDADVVIPEGRTSTIGLEVILQFWQNGSRFDGVLEYRTELFSADFAWGLLRHFRHTLREMLGDAHRTIGALPVLPPEEQAAYAELLRGPRLDALEQSLYDFMAGVARRNADRTAVVAIDPATRLRTAVTYAQLFVAADELAETLSAAGLERGDVVAVATALSIDSIALLLALWRGGMTPVPLDVTQPAARLRAIIAAARPRVAIGSSQVGIELELGVTTITVDALRARTARVPPRAADVTILEDAAAYVLFTSGTTGEPKGVIAEQAGVLNAFQGWQRVFELTASDVHLQMASFGFDVFFGDLIRGLGTGARLVLCPREWLLDPAALVGLARAERVTCAEFVPAVLRAVAEYLAGRGEKLDGVRLVPCGSDAWYPADYTRFREVLPAGARLLNTYGVTEATIDSTHFESRGEDDVEALLPVGRPFANVDCYVLDERLQLVPPGVPGELCIGGRGVARGYLGRAEQTAAKFVPDPFAQHADARLYRTGDRARYRRDGTLELLGRFDNQVKVRGVRIELGEIEAALSRYPGITANAVKLVKGDGPDRAWLAAYLVAGEGVSIEVADVRRFLEAELPLAMVPSGFAIVDALPVNANGKIDRDALPSIGSEVRQAWLDNTEPRTPTETALADIWAELLALDAPSGVHADFFELGGYSLLVPRLMWLIRERLGVEVPVGVLYRGATVAELALHIDALAVSSTASQKSVADLTEHFEF
jgi:amino acid adenylation domain-containing protein